MAGGEHKTYTYLTYALFHLLCGQIKAYPGRLQHIGTAGFTRNGAVAMLGDTTTGRGCNKD